MKKRIAIIGGGIAGLSAAWLLSTEYDVTLFEKESGVGGHAHTIDVPLGTRTTPVDVGFMVFNPGQYPHFSMLLRHLGVETTKTNMSFIVSVDDGEVEFSGAFPHGIFADRNNMFSPRFFRFLLDIVRFNAAARRALKEKTIGNDSVGVFLDRHGFKTFFRHHYLYPMAGSIWSGSFGEISEFPAQILFEFLHKNHLLEIRNKPTWHTIVGGSREYVRRMVNDIERAGGVIKTHTSIDGIRRAEGGFFVQTHESEDMFDYGIMATHADVSYALVKDLDPLEAKILGSFEYGVNHIVIHSDPSNMPRRTAAWASWNFCCPSSGRAEHVYLSYHMNKIQHIDDRYPIFVTLNPQKAIDKALVHARFLFTHPIFTHETRKAQQRFSEIQGMRNTFYCGAYTGYGFHEDGLASGMEVARLLGVSPPWNSQ